MLVQWLRAEAAAGALWLLEVAAQLQLVFSGLLQQDGRKLSLAVSCC